MIHRKDKKKIIVIFSTSINLCISRYPDTKILVSAIRRRTKIRRSCHYGNFWTGVCFVHIRTMTDFENEQKRNWTLVSLVFCCIRDVHLRRLSFFLLINGDSIRYPSSINWYPSPTKDVTLSYSAWHLITWYDRGIITSTPIEKKWLFVRLIVITGPVYCYIPINNKYSSKLSQKSINHNK